MAKKQEKLSLEEMLEQALVKDEDRPYEVPGNWVWVRLENLVSVLGDGLHGTPIYSESGDYYFINGNNLNDGFIDIKENTKKVDIEEFLKYKKPLNNRTVFVSINGTLGNVAFYNNENIILGKSACYFNLYEKVSKKYIMYLIKSDDFINYANKVATGTTIKNVSLKSMRDLKVPLPPHPEQMRIVASIESLFEKLDRAKELVQNALDSFENRKSAILHKAFSGELTAKWREENRVDIESDWAEKKIKDVCKISSGGTPSRTIKEYYTGNIPWIKTGEIVWNSIFDSEEKITQEAIENSSAKLFPVGTVLVAMYGQGLTRGRAAILSIEASTNQAVCGLLSNNDLNNKFLYYYFMWNYWRFREKAVGGNQPNYSGTIIGGFDINVPPLSEQHEIVRILDTLLEKEQRAKELCDLIKNIDNMKKSILARAFRGELGTNNPEEESALDFLKLVLQN